jgi:Glucose / Sorbosone dehydrogenase/RTX calcium-binding nonapeptide repeat (4 copies)
MRAGLGAGLTVAAALLFPSGAAALTLEPVGNFSQPVYVTSDPSDPDRLLVVEKWGGVVLSDDGVQTTFLQLGDLVSDEGHRGLQSIALAPDYAETGRLYVYYSRAGTDAEPGLEGDVQIDELTANGDTVDLDTRRPVLTIEHSEFADHYGGQLQFGHDGYLYISTGDGGCCGDPLENAQDLGSLLGKVLRIDPRPSDGDPYSIPSDNPFVGEPGEDEIWSYGLRNPWRFSFDRVTGDMVIGDVGQDAWEEIDYAPAPAGGRGVNFGWDCREGMHDYEPDGCAGPFAEPVFEYPNDDATCSITGGYVVRDPSLDDLYGRYVYADLCADELRSLELGAPLASGDRFEHTLAFPASFGEDSCARLYVTSLQDSRVYRLTGSEAPDCGTGSPPSLPSQPSSPARTCRRVAATMVAEPGQPTRGTHGNDVIIGTPGPDTIRARGGSDLICGTAGDDRLRGGRGGDELNGGPGTDRCPGGPGQDRKRGC